MTLYEDFFYYLLTLNEALLQHFVYIFVIKKADSIHKIRNNNFLTLIKGRRVSLNAPLFSVYDWLLIG